MFKSLKLHTDLTIRLEEIISSLIAFGYKRQAAVGAEGDFSVRGGIVDIFPFSFELPIRIDLDGEKIYAIKTFNPSSGELLWEHRIAIILPFKKTAVFHAQAYDENFPLNNFIDLKSGDYVVHNLYGIGKFLGMEKLKVRDKHQEHLAIEYEGGEKLYVGLDSMHLVQKYIGFAARRPKLYRLGGKQWQRVKNGVRKKIQRLAWELLSLQALRMKSAGFSYSVDSPWQEDFEKTFPFKETPDQVKAVFAVKKDMEEPRPMDRLLCGDVGYGKTEVAMRAAFKAVMDNKQVAYLVPTTILAEQHYQNFKARLKNFPINLELLCRFKTAGEQKNIIVGLIAGTVDIVIGTHRLLSGDVAFKDLGLVIIDEEQRFGVKAKEKLKSLRVNTDILTLTATPIPRTLYMSLMGAKDLSVINTPPQNRLPIRTVVVEYDEELIRQAILKEANRKGQVFYLHNRIQDIEKTKDRLVKLLPSSVRIAVAHGQMAPKFLEQVMAGFLKGEIDCLLCTMIIESGIDIPNVNTIIVENAHTFGLSDLHQLRGRVGRFDKPAYAYFLLPKSGILASLAKKRLSAMEEHAYLGAGFNLAMEDLELRGAGNLLGTQQHGFIAAVGFDLYCRLLHEAISNFRKVMENG